MNLRVNNNSIHGLLIKFDFITNILSDIGRQRDSVRFGHFTSAIILPGACLFVSVQLDFGRRGVKRGWRSVRSPCLFRSRRSSRAYSFLDRRNIINGRLPGCFFILDQPDFLFGRMILCKPLPEFCAGSSRKLFSPISINLAPVDFDRKGQQIASQIREATSLQGQLSSTRHKSAEIGTCSSNRLPRLHRVGPSASLDECYYQNCGGSLSQGIRIVKRLSGILKSIC